jgi:hypothetical protein
LTYIESQADPRTPATVEANDDAGVHREVNVQRGVLDSGHQFQIERKPVALPHGNTHRKADDEIIRDRRRRSVGVRDQWKHGSKMTPEPILCRRGCPQ